MTDAPRWPPGKHPGGRPRHDPEDKSVRVNITLEPQELAALDALAADDGIPRSHEVARLVGAEKKRRSKR